MPPPRASVSAVGLMNNDFGRGTVLQLHQLTYAHLSHQSDQGEADVLRRDRFAGEVW